MGENSNRSIKSVFFGWWIKLTDADNEGRHADREDVARLRRLDLIDFGQGPEPDVAMALTIGAFQKLYREIAPTKEQEGDLVVAAATLARIRTDVRGQTTAGLLGGHDEESRRMKQTRFLRLMRVSTSGELFGQARRIANLLGGSAPVGELGASLLLWRQDQRVRRDWARAYYGLDRANSDTPRPPIRPSWSLIHDTFFTTPPSGPVCCRQFEPR